MFLEFIPGLVCITSTGMPKDITMMRLILLLHHLEQLSTVQKRVHSLGVDHVASGTLRAIMVAEN